MARGDIKRFRDFLNAQDDGQRNHRHGHYQQRRRKYGDYLYNQDREKFMVDMKEWLKTNPGQKRRPLSSYVKKFYDAAKDPMWVIGCIDHSGAVRGRVALAVGNVMHGPEDSVGKRWRWNIWGQDYIATNNSSHEKLSDEEWAIVNDWLERRGFKAND